MPGLEVVLAAIIVGVATLGLWEARDMGPTMWEQQTVKLKTKDSPLGVVKRDIGRFAILLVCTFLAVAAVVSLWGGLLWGAK